VQALFFFLSSPAITRVEEGLLLVQAQVKEWCTMICDSPPATEPRVNMYGLNQNGARHIPTRLLWTEKIQDKRIRTATIMLFKNFSLSVI